jgi:hypothetical protein
VQQTPVIKKHKTRTQSKNGAYLSIYVNMARNLVKLDKKVLNLRLCIETQHSKMLSDVSKTKLQAK